MTVAKRGLGLLSAVVLAAACGSSSTASSNSSPSPSPEASAAHIASVDACSLVTAAQASTAVGATVVNLSAAGGVTIPGACFFGDTSGSSNGVFIYAQVYPDATAASTVDANTLAAALGGRITGVNNAKVVTGIGDKAIEYSASGTGGNGIAILVFKANVVMIIAVDPAPDPSKVEDLARTAANNLH